MLKELAPKGTLSYATKQPGRNIGVAGPASPANKNLGTAENSTLYVEYTARSVKNKEPRVYTWKKLTRLSTKVHDHRLNNKTAGACANSY